MYLKLLQNAITGGELISSGNTVVVGVSGGADSVALLTGLNQLAPTIGFKLAVAHLNHAIRAEEADIDAEFVELLSISLGFPFYSEKVDVPFRSLNDGISLEMAARIERYEFFSRAAEHFGTKLVATAHTADDQAETVLLKLARGAGIDGLSGIAFKSEQDGLCLIRPLLNISRKELVGFLKDNKQDWREDPSNRDVSFLRNRVRHDLLPWLKNNLNYSIKETVCRTAAILRDESSWLNSLCVELLGKYCDSDGLLDATGVSLEPVAARRRVLRLWLSSAGVDVDILSYKLIQRADELLCRDNAGSCSVELPDGYLLTRQYDKLLLESGTDNNQKKSFRVRLDLPGEKILSEVSLRIVTTIEQGIIKEKTVRAGNLPAKASISLTAAGGKPLYIRSWVAGDRMKPFGIEGTQKLQDIFVNEKVPLKQRGLIPVVECADEIVWIPGFRIARGWELLSSDESAIHVAIERV